MIVSGLRQTAELTDSVNGEPAGGHFVSGKFHYGVLWEA